MARTVKNGQVLADPVGAPDFTLPVSILAQVIESLKVDISAQSIPTLNINIASISQGVTITTTVSNMPSTFPLPSDQISSLQQVTIQNVAAGLYIPINIARADATVNSNATISGVVAGVYVPITIHSVESGVIFNINISSVSAGVTFNVNITGTPTINVQTSGGANIVIDKLTQDAYTERRDVLANNGATATMVASNLTNKRGKFFSRGCRGFLRYVEIYCDNADSVAHTFTVKIAPMPGMGAVYTGTVSVAAGSSAAWRMVHINKYWNYDSMFLWVTCDSDSYGRLGYDTGEPHDCYMSTDEVSWLFYDYRFWFRIASSGMTVGDLPVSGTVNTIEVPSTVTSTPSGFVTIAAGSQANLFTFYGAGECVYLMLYAEHEGMCFRVKVDGSEIYFMPVTGNLSWQPSTWYYYFADVNAGVGVVQTKRDTTNLRFACEVTLPISFRRSLSVDAVNIDAASSRRGGAVAVIKRIA